MHSKGKLQPDREAKLNELQFTWSEQLSLAAKNNWDASYQKLVEFKSRFGHCRVPAIWREDPPLGIWVMNQRRLQLEGKLKPDRKTKLKGIQFSWTGNARKHLSETYDAKWDASYQKLVEFKSRFGHCEVPSRWKEDPALGRWVAHQRLSQSKGTLQPDRVAKLNVIQSSWTGKA
jgi:hypothetical protein